LLSGSPAIDAGDDAACLPTDQRGVVRPQGAHCDIGAYEREDRSLPALTPTPLTPAKEPIVFDPVIFSDKHVYHGGESCRPNQLTVRARVSPADQVESLGLFYRLEEKDGGETGARSEGSAMNPQGDGWYKLILVIDDILTSSEWTEDAWLAIQFVANGKNGEILARSEVLHRITVSPCTRSR
jgi:hypothetical protein